MSETQDTTSYFNGRRDCWGPWSRSRNSACLQVYVFFDVPVLLRGVSIDRLNRLSMQGFNSDSDPEISAEKRRVAYLHSSLAPRVRVALALFYCSHRHIRLSRCELYCSDRALCPQRAAAFLRVPLLDLTLTQTNACLHHIHWLRFVAPQRSVDANSSQKGVVLILSLSLSR